MPTLPATTSTDRRCVDIAGDRGNPQMAQPRRFDHPADALLARLDAFELELLVKLQSLETAGSPRSPGLSESANSSPAPRLPVAEIVRIVAVTAVLTAAVFALYVLLLLR